MKLAKASGTIGLATLAVLASPFASAQDTGWYTGASVGQSRANIDNPRITRELLSGGLSTTSISNDDRSTGYKLYGGYQINRNFALEGGYFDLGEFGFTANTVPAGTLNGNIRLRGLNLDLVGTLPVTEKFSVFGRAGVTYTDTRDHFSGTGAVRVSNPDPSNRGGGFKYGAGLQYAFTPALSVRAEAERYRINDAVGNRGDVDLVSVGLVYRFGEKPRAPTRAAAPEPFVASPAPQVAIAPPPPAPPAKSKVSFSADSLFDFDKSVIKPAGSQELDRFASDLRGASYDVVSVAGHTDRLGSQAYNAKLSTRRADAVKSYLVTSAAIPSGKIDARGAGSTSPVTKIGECQGTKATPKLIACLQPDRRVEVEVTGMR